MSVQIPLVDGQQATWEDYEQLGEDGRVEHVDGRLLVSPSPTRVHQRVCRLLADALEAVAPDGLAVTAAWSWRPGADEFIPDVVVHPRTEESVRSTGLPVLAVEVLSSNRHDDPVLTSGECAAAGLQHHWAST